MTSGPDSPVSHIRPSQPAVDPSSGGRRAASITTSQLRALAVRSRAVLGRRRHRPLGAALAVVTFAALTLVAGSTPAASASCDPNPVVCENALPGNPITEWDISGAGDYTIQGFATDISVNAGQPIGFKIDTPATSYTIDIYRLGWYGGDGARKITSLQPPSSLPQVQPANCYSEEDTQFLDCGNWALSATWNVPSTAVSGVYIARLKRTDVETGDGSHITFIVRNDSSTSDIMFKTSDATWQAYNRYGGANFYDAPVNGRALKLSYNRPFGTRGDNEGRDFLFSNEYPMLRFLERNGYDVTYSTDVDADRRGHLIQNHKIFMSTGHDEYWSGAERANVEEARDSGTNLAFFSGNEVYWRTRWAASQDGSNTPYRTLVCYKETWGHGKIDTTSPEWTGTWRDPRFASPANGGGLPENALTGTMYMANYTDLAIKVPAAQGKNRFWRGTTVATLPSGGTATLAPHTVGYESNEDIDNGFRPAGLIRLSTTVGPTPEYLLDFGNQTAQGTTTHHMTLYRAPSGALVFSAGTVQWAWGLDEVHDGTISPADSRMQQATLNLFADMGVQPATRMAGLAAASASSDTTAPTVTITSPTNNTAVTNGAQVTLEGTAADTGGGVVAGVEVSTDGGATWHPANGTTSWTYSFFSSGAVTQVVRVRAIDDSVNIGNPATTVTLKLNGPSTIFGNRVPATPSVSDTAPVELGVRFTAEDDGYVTGVRFYKGTNNSGTHTGSLWSASGERLATGTFVNETSSGWQKLVFSDPVAITKNTVYVASYTAPNGGYAADGRFFSLTGFDSSPLNVAKSVEGNRNGVFAYNSGFPTESYNDTNYYVDVMFIDSEAGAPSPVGISPVNGATIVPVSVHPSVVFSKAINPSSIDFVLEKQSNGADVAGTVAYDSGSKRVTFTPSEPLDTSTAYRATVDVTDTQGNPNDAPTEWAFTTDAYETVNTLFATNATPAVPADSDTSAIELGVKFKSSKNGLIIGVRFYQGPGNSGTHTGSLWSSSGTLLARATFAGETGSGWQSVRFDQPISVTAGTTYVASYHAPKGRYAASSGFFSTIWTNGPLSTPATTANGVYRYGTEAFPNNSYGSTNYWVDPLFVETTTSSPSPSPTPTTTPTGPPSVSVFTDNDEPQNATWDDPNSIEVGAKFTSDVAGQVTGVRFYKGTQNNGIHTGSLWTEGGDLLASVEFTNESASGWQTATFSEPVTITQGTTYVVSYWTSVGKYAVNLNAFNGQGVDNAPLHIPAGGGLFKYGEGFPDGASNHNFWVDVVFRPSS